MTSVLQNHYNLFIFNSCVINDVVIYTDTKLVKNKYNYVSFLIFLLLYMLGLFGKRLRIRVRSRAPRRSL
ncbi:hypothetical protein DsansV1_C04g0040341 [Dioscorea sansibarensis]